MRRRVAASEGGGWGYAARCVLFSFWAAAATGEVVVGRGGSKRRGRGSWGGAREGAEDS